MLHPLKRLVLGCGLLGLCAAAQAQGPISPYYLTAGDEGMNWVVQGNAVVNSWAQAHPEEGGEYAIAVSSTVRTLGNGNQGFSGPSHVGSEYTLGGVFTGTTYPYPVPNAAFYDGTTDGTHNYSVDYGNGGVWQFDSAWANPVSLFATAVNDLGITFDPLDNTLWVSAFNGNTVTHYSLAGAVLGSFVGPTSSLTSLALDPADGTLWMGSQATQGTFYQYSRAGAPLGTVTYTELVPQNTLGGEFASGGAAAVPEPGSLAMLGACGLGLLGIRRLRRK
jgi:hypothetical protein